MTDSHDLRRWMLDVLLLPGMDGTGRLYSRLMGAMPQTWRATVLEYPSDVVAGYDELLSYVRGNAPDRQFLLIAESYSTPLAIRFAAARPEHLVGVVLCAGFASSPLSGWRRLLLRTVAPLLFRLPLQDWALRRFLLGNSAESALMSRVRETVATVEARVLAARLVEILRCDVREDLASADVRMLYLQALSDRLVGAECLEEISAIRSDVRVARRAGPHLLFQREPEWAAEAIEEFVRELR